MLITKCKPACVGDILTEEFMRPLDLTQATLAEAMGVQRKHVNELCNDRRAITAAMALILASFLGRARISGLISSAAPICGRLCKRHANSNVSSGAARPAPLLDDRAA